MPPYQNVNRLNWHFSLRLCTTVFRQTIQSKRGKRNTQYLETVFKVLRQLTDIEMIEIVLKSRVATSNSIEHRITYTKQLDLQSREEQTFKTMCEDK